MFPRIRSLWNALSRRGRFERDLDDELAFHLESRAADLQRTGLAPEEAFRRARIELGPAQAHKDTVREARGLRLFDQLAADIRFALRGWRRHRGLALAVVATLTVGIGISTAVFTVVNAFIFRAHGVPDPESFARVFVAQAVAPELPDKFDDPEREDLEALLKESRSFRHLAAVRTVSAPLGDDAADVDGRLVSCNVFSVFGPARPALGRLLVRDDCFRAQRVLVLSEAFWQRRFGGDPSVVGRVVSYNQQPFVVVGVVERSFKARGVQAGVFLPYTLAPDWPAAQRWQGRFLVAGRLPEHGSFRQARAELQVLLEQQDRQHPGRASQVKVTNGSLWQEPGHTGPKVMIVGLLAGALCMIVLLAAANVVTLLLSRAHARRQEIAVRLALGAGRGRLMKMLMTETLLLAIVAAGLSLIAAHQLPPVLVRWLAPEPIDLALDLDWRVWGFLVGVTLVAAVSAGLTPALETLKVDLVPSLKGRQHGSVGDGKRSVARGVLIGAQIALGMALLTGAALFTRSYLAMPLGETALDSRQILFSALGVRPSITSPPLSWPDVQRAVATEVAALPRVRSVAFSEDRPPGGDWLEVRSSEGQHQRLKSNAVSAHFFETVGLAILRGRGLHAGDVAGGTTVPAVVSNQLARQLWPGQDPLGQSLQAREGQRFQVVGVAADVIVPGESDGFSLYQPLSPGKGTLLVRFTGEVGPVRAAVRAAIARAEPRLKTSLRTLQERFDHQAAELKPAAGLTLGLGLVALILALVGVHGVVSFAARRQLKEIGVRMALGAQRRDVIKALALPAVRCVALGLGSGLLITLLAAPLLARTVQEMNVWDPLPYGGAALLLAVTALAAMVRPARWALAVDPAVVLRED